MGDELRIESRPALEKPVMVCAFRGWNDGGQGASLACTYLARAWQAEEFATVDPENFFDFQMTRPTVKRVSGGRRIEWPENSFQHAHVGSGAGARDAVLLLGTEPSLRWKSFTGLVTRLASQMGVSMVVTLGSLLADVPHTRPAPVTASATDPELLEQLGLSPSRYEGPTGVVGVLLATCREGALRPARRPARSAHRHQ